MLPRRALHWPDASSTTSLGATRDFHHGLLVFALGCALFVLTTTVQGNDWPEWRGAGRLGLWTEIGILDRFPDDGLEFTWRVPIRSGFAGPAVADGRVFVLDYLETPGSRTMDGTERLVCLDEETGEALWTHEWATTYRMLMSTYATGPRATPTPIIIDDHIYGVDSYGELRALDLLTGERLWTSDQMTVQARWGAAFIVKNGDRFFVNNDAEYLMIAQFTPDGYVEIDRTRLLEPTTSVGFGARRSFDRAVNWSHPAYANRHIIARNDHEIVRASLAKEQ